MKLQGDALIAVGVGLKSMTKKDTGNFCCGEGWLILTRGDYSHEDLSWPSHGLDIVNGEVEITYKPGGALTFSSKGKSYSTIVPPQANLFPTVCLFGRSSVTLI